MRSAATRDRFLILAFSVHGRTQKLPTNAEALDQGLVAAAIGVLEIVQETATLVDHLEQATTRMMILVVIGAVLGQMFDARGKQHDLDLGRARVVGGAAVDAGPPPLAAT